ncbi:hypothetical protein ABT124_38005 [Streptomyces sp. NPDC001982]|uniref:hypothetical protein n=1 Tax=Streptomyces sp. NPDC001982 TaxID=3154405 RepID=UPI00331E2D2D
MTQHSRKRRALRSEEPGEPSPSEDGLQQIRDALPPARHARTAVRAPRRVDAAVPEELMAAVVYHCGYISKHLAKAQHLGSQHKTSMDEWQRLVLYALTDALAHNQLLVGALAAYLQRQEVDDNLVRRYLQTPDPDRYVTRHAIDHLDGLTGSRPETPDEPAWTHVGRLIARNAHEAEAARPDKKPRR